MAIDPNIPLSVRQVSLPNILAQAESIKGAQKQNELLGLNVQTRRAQMPAVQSKARNEEQMEGLRSSVIQAERLRRFVDAGDMEGALRYAQSQPGPGAQQAAQAVQKAMQGDPSDLAQSLDAARQLGTRLGLFGTSSNTVQSSFMGENGNRWIIRRDGTVEDTGVPAVQYAQRPIETARGLESFDPTTGRSGQIISRAEDITQTQAQRRAAVTEAEQTAQADVQRRENEPARRERVRSILDKTNRVEQKVDEAIGKVNRFTTGFGSLLQNLPASQSRELRNDLTTIRATLAFDTLQQMRDASPTGGALGQVSERELSLLEGALEVLDQATTQDQLVNALNDVRRHYQNWRQAALEADRAARQRLGPTQQGEYAELSDEELLRRLQNAR